jgi:HSP20 family protein
MPLTVFDNLLNLEREIGRMFNGFAVPSYYATERSFPALDVTDDGSATVIAAEMPGVRKEDLKITIDNNVLTVSGERKKHAVPEKGVWIRSETWDGKFSRSVQLPRQIRQDAIAADLKDGILRIVVPKAEEAKPREVAIR